MGNIDRNDYIGWLAKLLLDPRRGDGFIATEFIRRLPKPGCAVGIVDSITLSFSNSGSTLSLQAASDCLNAVAENLPGEAKMIEQEGSTVFVLPLPQADVLQRRAILLAAGDNDRAALEANKEVVEQVADVMRQALAGAAAVAPNSSEDEEANDKMGE